MALMKVLLPAPGTPEMPTRTAWVGTLVSSVSSSRASSRWAGRRDSTSVMDRATAERLPARTPSTRAGTSNVRGMDASLG